MKRYASPLPVIDRVVEHDVCHGKGVGRRTHGDRRAGKWRHSLRALFQDTGERQDFGTADGARFFMTESLIWSTVFAADSRLFSPPLPIVTGKPDSGL